MTASAKKVMFSLCLFFFPFVCLSAGQSKTTQPMFTKFGGKVAHGTWKKPSDFGVEIRITLRIGVRVRIRLGLRLGRRGAAVLRAFV